MDAAELTAHVEAAVASVDNVAAVYLFGSVAAGTDTATSDVDLGLVVLNSAPAELRIRVMRAERLLVDRNRSARIRFEVATRNEYFDLEPMLLEYRRPRQPRETGARGGTGRDSGTQ